MMAKTTKQDPSRNKLELDGPETCYAALFSNGQ